MQIPSTVTEDHMDLVGVSGLAANVEYYKNRFLIAQARAEMYYEEYFNLKMILAEKKKEIEK